MFFNAIEDVQDAVIREAGPYVKVLFVPKQDEHGQWTAVAQVDGTLAIVALTVTPIPPQPETGR